jgi:hypothetical protein
MRNVRQIEPAATAPPSGDKAASLDVVQMVHDTCRLLAGAVGIERVDITLEPNHATSRHMPLIRQCKDVARSWDLDMYIRLQAGVLRLTFIKRKRKDDTRRTLTMQNGNCVDQAG